ncbi:MAG: hypothetical protein EOP00_17175 [Pedobacter sp.]|nr:MAG: hypothetical protein EOP00_17175 [Pedobacter sp.]
MYFNRLSKPSTNLFVHFDKNIYSNNETVYFTGYVVKPGIFKFSDHKIMAVALVRDLDTAIIKQDKFVMQNGISFGSMVIPDSIATGNYHFLVYTDKLINQKPELIFKQAITLKTNIEPAFKANITLTEPATDKNRQHKVLLTVTSADNRFLTKPAVVNYKYGKLTKATKTDASSQLLLSLPNQPNLIDPNLYVKLSYLKDSSFVSLALPQPKAKASVKFYPEGGNLVAGISANIAWEVTDQQRSPLALKAFLFKNNQVIDTIETSSYGIGKFRILPEQGSNYTVRLVHDNLADSIYNLPKIISNGLVISMEKAVVNDSVQFVMKSNIGHKFNIRLHNFEESFMYIPFDMGYKTRAVKIALTDIPKGLVSLTVSDTLHRPVSERLFFAHYNQAEQLALFTDKPNYSQREKVNLSLHLQDTTQHSLVSIAVVQDNRLNLKNTNDIRSYTYLKNELSKMPTNLNGNAFKDQDYIEQMLLVKGWRRYTWQDLPSTEIEQKRDSLTINTIVTRNNKPWKDPIKVGAFGDEKIRLAITDAKGILDLYHPDFVVDYGKKMFLFVNENNKYAFRIKVNDYFSNNTPKIAKLEAVETDVNLSTLTNNAQLVLKGNEKAIRLKEVVIKSKNNNAFNYAQGSPGSNPCGDYVCTYNILNCRNHTHGSPGNTQPIAGRTYMSEGRQIVYQECKVNAEVEGSFVKFDGIRYHKEFYMNDYKDPQEPAFFSTLYWNYNSLLKGNAKTDLSFYTSDITGKFKIIVQGVSNKDVIYSEHFFEVKPKQNP